MCSLSCTLYQVRNTVDFSDDVFSTFPVKGHYNPVNLELPIMITGISGQPENYDCRPRVLVSWNGSQLSAEQYF